jgi:formiminoglutamase
VWTPINSSLFFSKKDPEDIRLGDCATSLKQSLNEIQSDLCLWGYPDDEGISLNGGRVGAKEAPDKIRSYFYKMTPHLNSKQKPLILDAGNVDLNLPLAQRHEAGRSLAKAATDYGLRCLGLGGGHDYGYSDGAGFIQSCLQQNKRPLIINFDAHLDVRPTDRGLNSGTPFFRLLTEFKKEIDFFEIGLQPHCNSQNHWNWAKNQGAHLAELSEVSSVGLMSYLNKALQAHRGRPVWVSLDIDAITSTEAPGCSQSWTTGLKTDDLWQSFEWLHQEFSWKNFSIFEVSPPLDSDHRTSKLAAQFAHHFLSLGMKA